MRTREQAMAANPPPFDVLVWVPSTARFERHATLDALPVGLFPTEAADLPLLLPNKTPVELDHIAMAACGRTVSPMTTPGTEAHYKRLWWHLRHMPVTEPKRAVPSFIPRNYTVMPTRRERRPGKPIHKIRSGASRPGSNHRWATQNFELIYVPRQIESRDLAFLELPPLAQEVMGAIFSIGKKKFTRLELAAALETYVWNEPIETPGSRGRALKPKTKKKRKHLDAWGRFTRSRALLARAGFIRCEVA